MYSVSEVAKKIGVARSTLLYYERIGLITPSRDPQNRYRRYSQQDLAQLVLLRQLQKAGFTLAECQQCMAGDPDPELIGRRLFRLEQELEEMRMARDVLRALFSRATGQQPHSLRNSQQLREWHAEFEKRSSDAHIQWLKQLGFTEKESVHIRWVSRNMTENTEYMKHFFEVFENMKRSGPGSRAATLRAFRSLPEDSNIRNIMDIGCGKGAASLILAAECDARITAVDNHPPFLNFLTKEAGKQGYGERIIATCGSMFELGFQDGSFDLIWAEGSAYIMGFEKALTRWKRLIRDGGFLFVSDAVLLTDQPSPECAEFWTAEYPDITDPDSRRQQAENLGYDIVDSFILPHADWISFYSDMQRQVDAAISKYGMTPAFADMKKEIRISELYGNEYGYVCLLLRKR